MSLMGSYHQRELMEDYRTATNYTHQQPYTSQVEFSDSWLTNCFPSYISSSPPEQATSSYGSHDDSFYCQPPNVPLGADNRLTAYPESAFTVVSADNNPYPTALFPHESTLPSEPAPVFMNSLDEIIESSLSPFPEPMMFGGKETMSVSTFPGHVSSMDLSDNADENRNSVSDELSTKRQRKSMGLIDRRYHQRSAANRRERKRMLLINEHFEVLRSALPAHAQIASTTGPGVTQEERRLSKVETLKSAIRYIADLAAYLRSMGNQDGPSDSDCTARLRVCLEDPVIGAGGVMIREVTLSFGRREIGAKSEEGTVTSNLWFPSVVSAPELSYPI